MISTGRNLIGAIEDFKPQNDRIAPALSQGNNPEPRFNLLQKSSPVLLLALGAGLFALLYYVGEKVDEHV